jgi:hypothetical protein
VVGALLSALPSPGATRVPFSYYSRSQIQLDGPLSSPWAKYENIPQPNAGTHASSLHPRRPRTPLADHGRNVPDVVPVGSYIPARTPSEVGGLLGPRRWNSRSMYWPYPIPEVISTGLQVIPVHSTRTKSAQLVPAPERMHWNCWRTEYPYECILSDMPNSEHKAGSPPIRGSLSPSLPSCLHHARYARFSLHHTRSSFLTIVIR